MSGTPSWPGRRTASSISESTPSGPVARVATFAPTSHLHLDDYVRVIRPLVEAQYRGEVVAVVVDLPVPAATGRPAAGRPGAGSGAAAPAGDPDPALVLQVAGLLLAAGLDPDRAPVCRQSEVPVLPWPAGPAVGLAHESPATLAPDSDNWTAHEPAVRTAREPAVRVAHEPAVRVAHEPAVRLADLTDPARPMSAANPAGALRLLDPPDTLRDKIARAVGDVDRGYHPLRHPGAANLLAVLASCAGDEPAALAPLFTSYRELAGTVADAVVATLRPLQARYADLAAEPGYLDEVLRAGAARARERAESTRAHTGTAGSVVLAP